MDAFVNIRRLIFLAFNIARAITGVGETSGMMKNVHDRAMRNETMNNARIWQTRAT